MYIRKNDKLHAKTHYETMGFSFSVVSLLFCYYCCSVHDFRCAANARTYSRFWMHCTLHHKTHLLPFALAKECSSLCECAAWHIAGMPRNTIHFSGFRQMCAARAADATLQHSTYIKSMLHTHCVVQEWRRALSLTFSFVIVSIKCIRVSHWRDINVCGIWSVSRLLCFFFSISLCADGSPGKV